MENDLLWYVLGKLINEYGYSLDQVGFEVRAQQNQATKILVVERVTMDNTQYIKEDPITILMGLMFRCLIVYEEGDYDGLV